MTSEPESIQPQPGPQTELLSCSADIALYGGAAGGGKTYALLMDAARYTGHSKYRGVIFRRESVQITIEDGLWDTSQDIYGALKSDPEPVEHPRPKWRFPSGASVSFHHLQHEKDKLKHQGGGYSFIGFDEVTHFTESQVIYLISRMRSNAAMRPYMRWTCNPDGDSWVYQWVKPFLKDDGITPDPDKCGELRWFTIENGTVKWVDEDWREYDEDGNELRPMSFTFIPAKLSDNKYLGADYRAKLRAQSEVNQKRLGGGLWVTEVGKALFRNHRIRIVDPDDVPYIREARYWDLADTHVDPKDQEPRKPGGPDWTAGARGGVWMPPEDSEWHSELGLPILIVRDVAFDQRSGADKKEWMQRFAANDGLRVPIGIEREGGATGKEAAGIYANQVFASYDVFDDRPTGDKVERAKPWRDLAEKGRVWFVRGPWVAQVLWWVERFPQQKKDTIDAISGLYALCQREDVFPQEPVFTF